MPFEFIQLKIEGLILIKPKVFKDERGFFMETYKKSEFINAGIREEFVQSNHSKSTKSVLRGLHYQLKPYNQGKLVRCIKGTIFDVAVDIRIGSPTFAKWVSVELSEENHFMFYIPSGFAHGFITLSEEAEIFYKCTNEYAPNYDKGIIWNDPQINILWKGEKPILSLKDQALPLLKYAENNFYYEEMK
ncbi:MAG TPA: dTDP-4-dehydrorhamnose 3,5-epimerase [Nitrospirae bacterium]|nr:dTDP-4-dehydrorhamnose 3,5-epimerase [Nitrospirota bacterium]